jgi:hypothetical protein
MNIERMSDLSHILIFKTNIRTESDKLAIKPVLDSHSIVKEWHVDTEDIDCVLRIVSHEPRPEYIIQTVTQIGYQCSELE